MRSNTGFARKAFVKKMSELIFPSCIKRTRTILAKVVKLLWSGVFESRRKLLVQQNMFICCKLEILFAGYDWDDEVLFYSIFLDLDRLTLLCFVGFVSDLVTDQ